MFTIAPHIKPKAKKKLRAWIKTLAVIVALTILWTIVAIFTDVITLRKTEDMVGSENAISILFVGNSYVFVGELPRQLQTIARLYDIEIIYRDISRHGNRGGTLSELRESAIIEMQSGRFDYVILTCNGRRVSNDIDGFLDDVQALTDEARKNGVIPVLFNSAWVSDRENLNIATDAYKLAANEFNVVLVNAADAWVYAYQTIPEVELITRFDPRGAHPNSAGGFFTACVFAAILFDLHIEEIPSDSLYRGNNAITLAQAAWNFVHPSKYDE